MELVELLPLKAVLQIRRGIRDNLGIIFHITGWLVGCFGFNGPLRQYFSLYRAASQRGRKRREKIAESKNVQTAPTRTYCKRNRPLPYYHLNCRTPRHWKFTQNHRTTRPPHPYNWFKTCVLTIIRTISLSCF